jgi:acetylornithine deacetylase/succinyl-diaminopimelate desuccinylase-like protein
MTSYGWSRHHTRDATRPSLGGSLTLYAFHDIPGAPLVIVPIVNNDNNQHVADENLRLQNLWDGIEVYAHLMVRVGELW